MAVTGGQEGLHTHVHSRVTAPEVIGVQGEKTRCPVRADGWNPCGLQITVSPMKSWGPGAQWCAGHWQM